MVESVAKKQEVQSGLVKPSVPLREVYLEQSLLGKKWVLNACDDRAIETIVQKFQLSEIVARIISARGVALNEVENFLNPSLKNMLPDPSVFKDMDKVAKRLAEAIIAQEKIAIFW